MWQQRKPSSWGQIMIGSAMLMVAMLVGLMTLGNAVGLGRAVATIVLIIFAAAWVIIGIALTVRGLSEL